MGVADSQSVIDALAELDISKQEVLTLPLPVDQGGTGGNTPYVTDGFDDSATFVMYDRQNARYNASPMSSLRGYLDNRYSALAPTKPLSVGADLNLLEYGTYYTSDADTSNSLVNIPNHTFQSSVRVEQFANVAVTGTKAQVISENLTGTTFYRSAVNDVWYSWVQLYPTAEPTVPSNFSFQVSPFPAGDWKGEMKVNVSPVFSTTVGAVAYIMARVYGSNTFNYTGTADNIMLFSSLKATEYPYTFSGGTNITTGLHIKGRSYNQGTYGFAPKESGSGVLLNDQIVSSVFSSGDLLMSNNLNCVFGDGTNTPAITVRFNCLALMWHSVS